MVDLGEGGGLVVQLSGPFAGGGSGGKLAQILLPKDNWKGAMSPYTMTVNVDGLSVKSRVDIYPGADLLERLRIMGTGLLAGNEDGVLTVYAFGNRPTEDITVQATVTEVT